MTIEERKRAIHLERVTKAYSRSGVAVWLIGLAAVLIIILDISLFIIGLNDNDMFNILPIHNLMLYMVMGMFSMISTSNMGDNSTVAGSAENFATQYGSTIFTGKFLASLPFSAKDSLHLRLLNWERQLTASTIITAVLQTSMLIAENDGYEVNHGITGLCVIGFLGAETALMFISTAWHMKYMTLPAAFGAVFAIHPLLRGARGGYEELSASAEGLSFLSGVNGIIVTVVAAVLLAVGAEIWTKHRKNISWNMQ